MSKKRGGIPTSRVKFNRCRNCPVKYHGVEKDKNGKVLRVFDCKDNCLALSVMKQINI